MPITLDVSEKFAAKVELGQDIALRDPEGVILAIMSVTDRWTPDKAIEADRVFGADDIAHPAVNYLHNQAGQGLSRRPGHRHPAAGALRFQGAARHAQRTARLFPQARLAAHRRLPDPQPAAPRASGTDLPRRPRGPGQPADPPRRRHDQARRRRPFHPRALLRGGARPVPVLDHLAVAAQPRHAHGRPARGGLARASSGATTAAPTSSSAATTPARARTPRARTSTAPTRRRSSSRSIRPRSASRWSISSRWSIVQEKAQY